MWIVLDYINCLKPIINYFRMFLVILFNLINFFSSNCEVDLLDKDCIVGLDIHLVVCFEYYKDCYLVDY
jgi:hypothetical protein